jgi:hypothetical protein
MEAHGIRRGHDQHGDPEADRPDREVDPVAGEDVAAAQPLPDENRGDRVQDGARERQGGDEVRQRAPLPRGRELAEPESGGRPGDQ